MSLIWHQLRYDQRVFWRNPPAVFFTVIFPVLLLVIFSAAFGDQRLDAAGGIEATAYYVPAILSLAVIAATMQTLAMSLTIAREEGRLKRARGTPMPAWIFIAGRIANSVVVAALMLALVAVIGSLLYGVAIPWGQAPQLLVVLAIGAATFCCLGIAITAVIPSQEAAAPILNAILLPLYFLSGILIPEDELPAGVLDFAGHFPVRHFFAATFDAYAGGAAGIPWGDLAVVAAWGVAGLLLAVRFFRWTPRGG